MVKRCESCERGSAVRVKTGGGNCVCAEAKMDHELISVEKEEKKTGKKDSKLMLDCTEGSNVSVLNVEAV